MSADRSFERLESDLRESWLVRGAARTAATCEASLEHSSTTTAVRRVRSAWESTPANVRLRSVAVGMAVATLGHLALLRFVPPHVAPAVPRLFWVLVAATSLLVAALATPVAHAWSTSVVGGMWRAVTGWLAPESRRPARHPAP
jgi:hypothetical protein